MKNIKTAILFFIYIESAGNPLSENSEGSSAKGIGQWLIGNGNFGTEYMVNGKFYDKKTFQKSGFKHYDLKEDIYKTNSWETTLNYIRISYNEEVSNKIRKDITWFPKDKIIKPTHQDPVNISWKDQIKILALSFGARKNRGITKYTGTLLQGNIWAIMKIYEIFHHTSPKPETLKRIRKAEDKYYSKLIKIVLKDKK